MEKANKINAVTVISIEELPNGVNVIMTDCNDYDHYSNLPKAVEYKNTVYGKTGWNSDSNIAYYRTDQKVAIERS